MFWSDEAPKMYNIFLLPNGENNEITEEKPKSNAFVCCVCLLSFDHDDDYHMLVALRYGWRIPLTFYENRWWV